MMKHRERKKISQNSTQKLANSERIGCFQDREHCFWLTEIGNKVSEGIWSIDWVSDRLLYLNEAAEKIYGRNKSEFEKNSQLWLEVIDPIDRDRVIDSFSCETGNQGKKTDPILLDYSIIKPSGEKRRIRHKFSVFRHEDGTSIRTDSILTDITETTRTNEDPELSSKAQQKAQDIIGNWPGIFYQYILHPDGSDEFSEIGAGCRNIWEIQPQEILEDVSSIWAFVHPQDLVGVRNSIATSAQTLNPWKFEWRSITPSGKVKWLSAIAQPEKKENGDIIWDGLILDVTPSKKSPEELRRDRKPLKKLGQKSTSILQEETQEQQQVQSELDRFFQVSNDLVYIARSDGYFKRLNPSWESTLGYSIAELLEMPFIELVHPEDRAATLAELESVTEGGSLRFQTRYRCKDGSYKWLSWSGTVVEKSGSMYGVARDITDRKKIEIALQKSEARFQRLAANTPGMMYQFKLDRAGKKSFPYVSEGCREFYELEPEAIEQNAELVVAQIHPGDRVAFEESIAVSVATMQPWHFEWRNITPSGKLKWLKGSSRPSRLSDGSIIWDGIVIEITELKQKEEAIASTQRFIERITEFSPNVLYIYDLLDLRNVYANRSIGDLLGYNDTDLQNMGSAVLQNLMHPDDFARLGEHYQQFETAGDGDIFELEYRMRHQNGGWRWLVSRETVFARTADGKPKQLLGTASDITERKAAQAALQESEARYRAFVEAIPDLLFRQSADGIYLDFRVPSAADLAVPADTLIGKNVTEVLPAAIAQLVNYYVSVAISTGQVQSFEYQLAPMDGIIRDYEARVAPAGPNEAIGIVRDITAFKKTQKALQDALQETERSTQQLQEAQRIAHIGSWEFDISTGAIAWSDELFRIYGLEREKPPKFEELLDMIHPEDREPWVQAVQRAMVEGISYEIDHRILRSDGTWRYINGRGEAVRDRDGNIVQLFGTAMDISDRKHAEQINRRLLAILEATPDFASTCDLTGNVQYINRGGRQMVGIGLDEDISNVEITTLSTPEMADFLTSVAIPTAIRDGVWRGETTLKHRNDNVIPVSQVIISHFSESGEVEFLSTLIRDISEAKKIEAALREQEEFLRSIYEGIDLGITILDVLAEGEFRFAGHNPAIARMSPIPMESLREKTFAESLPIEVADRLRKRYRACVESGQTVCFEECLTFDKVDIWWLLTVTPLRNMSDKIYRLVVTSTNITERKLSELALQQSEAQYRELAKREELLNRLTNQIRTSLNLDTIIETTVDEIRNVLSVDRCNFAWYRTDTDEPVWELVKEAKHPALPSFLSGYNLDRFNPLAQKLVNRETIQIDDVDRESDPVIQQFLRSSGHCSVLMLPIQTESGEIGLIGCTRDRHVGAWTADEVELLQAVCNQLAIAIEQSQLYTRSRDSAQLAMAKSQELEKTLRELRKTQANLIQAEKMSSLGQMVAGVAHEINNPVNFIYGNIAPASEYIQDLLGLLELYREAYPQPQPEILEEMEAIELDYLIEDLPKVLNSMKLGAVRIKEIVQSLRTFSRLDEADMKEVNLHENIDSTLMILQNRLKGKTDRPAIELIKDYGNLPLVECFPGQLNQVFMNLLGNAIDALEAHGAWGMENGEEKHLSPSDEQCPTLHAQRPTIRIRTEAIDGNWVMIHITDNGIGMTKEVLSKIFDPFYTTKPIGKGTGLGLSISYQIIEKHQGQLRCTSEQETGTKFTIKIPTYQTKARANVLASSSSL